MTMEKPVPPCIILCAENGDLLFNSLGDKRSLSEVMATVRSAVAGGVSFTKGKAVLPCGQGLLEVHRFEKPGCSGYLFLYSPVDGKEAATRLEALCEENRMLNAVYESSGEGIVVADETGTYIRCNETYMRMTGLAWHDVVGKNAEEMIALGIKDYASAPAVIATKKTQYANQTFHSGLCTTLRGIPVFDGKGDVWRVVAYIRDISELESMRVELATSREKLYSLSQEGEWPQGRKYLFSSPSMRAVYEQAEKVARVDSPLLVVGETGVGKEVVTDLVHRLSPRSAHPLIKINCAAIPENLLEAEFFGYEGGSFTDARKEGKTGLLEVADKGTVFLDEVDSLPLAMQAKLLRFLQNQEFFRLGGSKLIRVDVRVIAASNQDLESLVESHRFRSDFFYRLNVLRIAIPPLRERVEDIVPLAHEALDRFNAKYQIAKLVSPLIYRYLLAYAWPGNIRELENVMERMVVEFGGDLLTVDALPRNIRQQGSEAGDYAGQQVGAYRVERDAFEKSFWEEIFRQYRTTREAAQATGVAQSSVVKKFQRYVGKEAD